MSDDHAEWGQDDDPRRVSRVEIYTTAPAEYDGFGTHTLETLGDTKYGQPLRKVSVRSDFIEWQTQRYLSGMYAAMGQADYDALKDIIMAHAETSPH